MAYDVQEYSVHNIDIIRHVDEKLRETRHDDPVNTLEGIECLHSAEHCPLLWHLILTNYEREVMNSQEIVTGVVASTFHTNLIGPE